MVLVQLGETIPVLVVGGCGWQGPVGNALAIGWAHYGVEHPLVWVVWMDETGQCWEVPNPNVRARRNITLGRGKPAAPSAG